MSPEDAFYYENLLVLGFKDEYDKWLNKLLTEENPLSPILLELSSCGSNINSAISLLYRYRTERSADSKTVCSRLREYLKNAFNSNQMDKGEVVEAMNTLASHVGEPGCLDMDSWGSMNFLKDYYNLAKNRIISEDAFDLAFKSYLNDGQPLDSEALWSNKKKRTSKKTNR